VADPAVFRDRHAAAYDRIEYGIPPRILTQPAWRAVPYVPQLEEAKSWFREYGVRAAAGESRPTTAASAAVCEELKV